MEAFKFALGPYEIFSSIIGGIPLTLAIFLSYNPTITLKDIASIIQGSFSTQAILLLILVSYLLGGLIQGITWKYFLLLCMVFKQDYRYFGDMIEVRNKSIEEIGEDINLKSLEFEDKLVLLLREKVGIPKKSSWINARLTSYLKERNSPSVVTSELYQATHIMYRGVSFGFLILGIIVLTNLVRVRIFASEQPVLILLCIVLSYIAFFRSLTFKRWHEREILHGFYFYACNDQWFGQNQAAMMP